MILGIGVDIVDVERMRRAVERSGQPFLDRLFSPGEQIRCGKRCDPMPCFALRFAAKEAVAKALRVGMGPMGFRNAEVCNAEDGAPYLLMHGWVGHWLVEHAGVRLHLSLSDSERQAVAMVMVESDQPVPLPTRGWEGSASESLP